MAHLFLRRFNDDLYSLIVGSAQHVFTIHKSTLSLSPVLACMTSDSFSEGVTREIVLPEDDADSFGRILEHLYGNNDVAFDVDLLDFDGAEKLADMYGLAEKYQLPDVQDRVIQKLKQLDVLRENRMTFFKIAHQIFQSTRDTDAIFQSYFATQAAIHLKSMLKEELEELSEMICLGGRFARKVFQVQADTYSEAHLNWLTDKSSLKESFAVTEVHLRSVNAMVAADMAKARRMHKSQHPSCWQCHVLR